MWGGAITMSPKLWNFPPPIHVNLRISQSVLLQGRHEHRKNPKRVRFYLCTSAHTFIYCSSCFSRLTQTPATCTALCSNHYFPRTEGGGHEERSVKNNVSKNTLASFLCHYNSLFRRSYPVADLLLRFLMGGEHLSLSLCLPIQHYTESWLQWRTYLKTEWDEGQGTSPRLMELCRLLYGPKSAAQSTDGGKELTDKCDESTGTGSYSEWTSSQIGT